MLRDARTVHDSLSPMSFYISPCFRYGPRGSFDGIRSVFSLFCLGVAAFSTCFLFHRSYPHSLCAFSFFFFCSSYIYFPFVYRGPCGLHGHGFYCMFWAMTGSLGYGIPAYGTDVCLFFFFFCLFSALECVSIFKKGVLHAIDIHLAMQCNL